MLWKIRLPEETQRAVRWPEASDESENSKKESGNPKKEDQNIFYVKKKHLRMGNKCHPAEVKLLKEKKRELNLLL